MERERRVEVQHPSCPYCKDGVRAEQAKVACEACMAWHHAECWVEHGACSACGARGKNQHAPAAVRPGCVFEQCEGERRRDHPEGRVRLRDGSVAPLRDLCQHHAVVALRQRADHASCGMFAMALTAALVGLAAGSDGSEWGLDLTLLVCFGLFAGLLTRSYFRRRAALLEEPPGDPAKGS